MLSVGQVVLALVWGCSSTPNGVLFQYGASPDWGQTDDGVVYTGNTYYIDYDNGNDSNSGMSKSLPWKTVARVNQACYYGGGINNSEAPRNSAFLFKRGQSTQNGNVYTLGRDVTGFFCSFTFGVYGTGARPEIIYATGMPGADFSAAVIGTTGSSSAGIMHGLTVKNMHLNGNGQAAVGGVFATWTDTVTYVNNYIENCGASGLGLSLSDQNNNNGQGGALISNNTITGCCTTTGNGAGMGGGGNEGGSTGPAGNVIVTYNSCYDNGAPGSTTSHQAYFYGLGANSYIWGNYCYNTANFGNCGLVIHGYCSGVTIARNKLLGCNNGLSLSCGYFGPIERFDSFQVYQNIIGNCGQFGTQGVGMTLQAVTNSNIYSNLLFNNAQHSGAADFLLQLGQAEDWVMDNTEIAQNTVYRVGGAISSGAALNISAAIGAIRFKNNVVQIASTTGNGQYIILKTSAMTDANLTLSNNCYITSIAGQITHNWNATSYTLAAFKTAVSGSESGSVYGDPRFVAAGSQNFQLGIGSPALGIGATLGYGYGLDNRPLAATSPAAGCYAAQA